MRSRARTRRGTKTHNCACLSRCSFRINHAAPTATAGLAITGMAGTINRSCCRRVRRNPFLILLVYILPHGTNPIYGLQ